MEKQTTTAGQGMGIAGLILGIITIPLALIPCTIFLALFFGSAGIILSAVGLHQANTANGTRGIPLSGLITSIVGMSIALMWGLFFASVTDHGKIFTQGKFWEQIEKVGKEIGNEVGKDIEESMKDLDEDFEKAGEDLEKTLEELESGASGAARDMEKEISLEKLDYALSKYEELIDDYNDFVENALTGDDSAVARYKEISANAVELSEKIKALTSEMTEKQKTRFEELQKKYEEALEKLNE